MKMAATKFTKPKSKKSTAPEIPKLSKADPDYYRKIGRMNGAKLLRRKGTEYFSEMAKRSHPRAEYKGGRRPKIETEQPTPGVEK